MPTRRKLNPETEIESPEPALAAEATAAPARRRRKPEIEIESPDPALAAKDAAVSVAESPAPESANGFAALGLNALLLETVRELGFEEPTPIQRRSIPILLEGGDLVAQAQTGTGKTAAFALPLLQRIDLESSQVQVLVLAPTRELAVQVAGSIYQLGRRLQVHVLPIYGGQPIERQLRALRAGVHVVIGTPGRVLDHLRRGSLKVDGVRTLILDEADEMLDMGFEDELEAILAELPASRQTALFSATIPPRIRGLADRYLKDAAQVSIEAERITVPQVKQTYYEVAPRAKLDALTRILDMETPGAALIFCRTKRGVDEVGDALISRGYPADTLHGDLSQAMRDRVMHRFREGQAELLVATDVAARGLDIEQISHVINFDIPEDPEQYVHRIGRTARAGRSGDAITLVAPREMRLLHEIERLIRKRLDRGRIPTAGDIAARRLEATKEAITRALAQGGLEPYLLAIEDLAAERDVALVAAATLRLMMERDGSGSRASISPLDGDAAMGVETGMQRLFLDVGRRQGVRPADIVGAIANEAALPASEIGTIDIYDNFTFVEVARSAVGGVIRALQQTTLHGQGFRVDIAKPREDGSPADNTRTGHGDGSGRRDRDRARADQPGVGGGGIPSHESPRPGPRGPAHPEGEVPVGVDEDEDDDVEPPTRPADWRDDPRPRGIPRYGAPGAQRGAPPRRGGPGGGRDGFGPFRGAEPREVPPWQRRRPTGERGHVGGGGGNNFGQGDRPYRPGRTDGPGAGSPPRRDGGHDFRGPRPNNPGGFRPPSGEGEARRPRRRPGRPPRNPA